MAKWTTKNVKEEKIQEFITLIKKFRKKEKLDPNCRSPSFLPSPRIFKKPRIDQNDLKNAEDDFLDFFVTQEDEEFFNDRANDPKLQEFVKKQDSKFIQVHGWCYYLNTQTSQNRTNHQLGR